MAEKIDHTTVENDEITLKELILKLQEFYREVVKYWKIVVLITLPFFAFFAYKALSTPVAFNATMTYMVNEDGNSGGGIGSILGQFGLGGGGGGEHNYDRIVELSKSMRIIREAFFEKGEVGGELDYYANHLIKSENFHELWKKDTTGMKGFMFAHDSISEFNFTEKRVLKFLYQIVIGKRNKEEALFKSDYKLETGILYMTMKTRNADLATSFLMTLYDKVSKFYIYEITEKPIQTYNNLILKRDSLSASLNYKERELARLLDSNLGLISKKAQLQIERLKRDVQIMTIGYGKIIENVEVADFSLKNAMPFFQVIDEPITPLAPIKEKLFKSIFTGGIIGGFFGILVVLGRKIYLDIMNSNS